MVGRARARMRMIAGATLGATCLVAWPTWAEPEPVRATADVAAPEAKVLASYASRASSLSRLWARVVFVLEYKDADGHARSEQGEGHLQFLAPDRLALSLGKVGQRVLYLGCDHDRFWFFDMTDGGRAYVGRNANVGKPCTEDTGLPANPLDVLATLGVCALPEGSVGRIGGGVGEARIFSTTPSGRLRITAGIDTGEPSRIELLPGAAGDGATWAGSPTIVATMSEYTPVEMRGGGAPVRMPKQIVMEARAREMKLTLHLYDPVRGSEKQLPPQAFDLDHLLDRLAPASVRELDAGCDAAPLPDGAPAQREG